jgi:putative SOS response-associated peptidase YedK
MLRDDDMPIYEAPDDPDEDDGDRSEAGDFDDVYNGPRQSYNFAPGYRGVVYRADVPDWGAGPRSRRDGQASIHANDASSAVSRMEAQDHGVETDEQQTSTEAREVHYKLQTMKWGLIPFWTKRNPGYGSMMKTINCRDDSLAQSGGMWGSMKGRKRCIVVAQGFYEWLKKDGGREKIPHYVKRKDGKLMCFAGLWDVVQYESK